MPSELDLKIRETLTALTAPGQLLELDSVEKFGVDLPIFKNAPQNVADFLTYFCHQHADKEFLVDGDIRLTFGETYAAARTLAGGLVEGYGVKKGDRIGIAARNSANWIILDMAITLAGGISTKLNGWWQGDELADGIEDVSCSLVFADPQRAARLSDLDRDTGAKLLIFEHDQMPLEGLKVVMANGGSAETPMPEITPEDNATILFTSGSTGRSKGAYAEHRAVVQGAMSFVGAFAVMVQIMEEAGTMPDIQPTAMVAVPLFHVTASVPLVLVSYAIGRKLVMLNKWDAEAAMKLIEKEKVTYFVGVPLMSMEIYSHPNLKDYDLSTCVSMAAGGAPRPVEHVKRIKEAMGEGFPIIGYGLTETNGVGCSNQNENYLAHPDSTGRATPPIVDVAILDDDGNQMPKGERGEVCIRTAANFTGYWNNEQATKEAFTDDGYFRTGDIGYFDEEAYLYIVDRKKEIIIRGGENISCQEVEDAIYSNKSIAEACIFGVEDERFGEVPALVYHVKDGHSLSQDELLDYLKDKLAPFKMPVHIWQYDEPLPKLGTAKIAKIVLAKKHREMLAETG
ncbi:Acyl-CoA synthetase (AMP-forming)/AMP-acid ligase II [Parasphingorhabdus marina DSM 22363]|uniref:Acyl-CoA synthetase (AMP-forming)/AMP-acid ligase II n=1 Tax=Parasphingorhabdus marina DSM 22363 TaxID=1123272 RepID=A0A1N6DEF0_9SPHN|nr:class I adenylate-forming enzyme family protein [Parasphingorhabdus marina]SIN69171.1 Acyl-CoA synthetase (AMP-forming)/AMP-acid ligase II [Parasphingorhabdus marina DSM 22363]